MPHSLRPALPSDEPFLLQMLFYAAHADEEPGMTPARLLETPRLARYVTGFGRAGDLGLLAVGPSGPVGAAWLRLLAGEERGYGWIADDIPELGIAVLPGAIGGGVGTSMLRELIAQARERYPAASLSVRSDNPARRLYVSFGFEVVEALVNRVGGKSETMVLRFG